MLWELFLTFGKIGLFTFGGGYAMIGVIEHACVEQKKWITYEELTDMTVIAESTPGPIAINCATYVGWKQGALPGAVAATVGVVLPSFTVIYLISLFLEGFLEVAVIANAFRGIRLAVGVLILSAGVRMIRRMKKTHFTVAVLAVSAGAMTAAALLSLRLSSTVLMVGSGVAGLLALRLGKEGKA